MDSLTSVPNGKLILENGLVLEGYSFGATKPMAGEVVFTTSMVGYCESISDPSYAGEILVLTFPMIGNYGVPPFDLDELGLLKYFEGSRPHISGLIVTDYSHSHSHWNAVQSLGSWLTSYGIPALWGIDTRRLTKLIRTTGTILGKIEFHNHPSIAFENPNELHLVSTVSRKDIQTYGHGNSPHIIAYDCGMKNNILRCLVLEQKACVTVVPYNYNLETNTADIKYDGIFVSNGPGDPTKCIETIASLRWAIQQTPVIPIFGICLGHQLLALACGASTYKMQYGNRGSNQPCVDLRTTQCFITSQNHGFAVNIKSLPPDWKPLFLNGNDLSNEGIIHVNKPYFSVQFHPEGCGGPHDTAYLFADFVAIINSTPPTRVLVSPSLYDQRTIKKVLLIGSGGLSIGQAGEFDYSGSQAIKALKEERIEVILINPNIATVQTSKHLGRASPDKVYFLPIRAQVVEDIIAKERPDGVIVSMGGQTALNVGIELYRAGIFEKYDCRVLGTSIDSIIMTEDRDLFSQKLHSINEHLAKSISATTVEEAIAAANIIGYPVLVRAAFALGGLGSGFAENESELINLAAKAFAVSSQILLDQDLRGWKEVEYEVVRDDRDNCITVCNMENFDPVGVHTGDSIVVAPSQTLSNSEYYKLRAASIKVIRSLEIVGECNIQYALNPNSEEYCIIEVNARLSRSSALASKATGYPLAYVAAKLSLGKNLVSIRNSITKTTTACFEPSLDYCVVKMPRWDLSKFAKACNKLGSAMSSVGEVMAIGKTFEEAMQKAVRMVSGGALDGLEGNTLEVEASELDGMLKVPTDKRLHVVQHALEKGYTVDKISQISKIDKWFLSRLKLIADLKKATCALGGLNNLTPLAMRRLKIAGFSDRQIARYTNSKELQVRKQRIQQGIVPFAKQIDTLAAEFPAQTNYLYVTYNASEHDIACGPIVPPSPKRGMSQNFHDIQAASTTARGGVMVLGCGAYCIGSSVEFDWCAVSAIRQLRAMGDRVIVVNYNPETVSTDYDESDVLYFEELTLERVMDIYQLEKSSGVIVSVGGQIPNNLALPLYQSDINILGTCPTSIDIAEDRHKFSAMLDTLKVDQPEWKQLITKEDAEQFAQKVGYPVLVRPSFVLSGAAMSVASTPHELLMCLKLAREVSPDKPVVISKYIVNAKEIEFDAVAQNGKILNYAISEHIENAGVHSGDATLVLPAQKLFVQTVRTVKRIAAQIAQALNISGPFNIQLLATDNKVRVIECNLRASRTFPFISKTFDVNFITLATKIMMGYANLKPFNISLYDYDYVAVKAPMFSFARLRGADPTLGVEMTSTGEVACFGQDMQEAFLQALLATNFKLPSKSPEKFILVSIGQTKMLVEFQPALNQLIEMGYNICCTPGTAAYYINQCGIPANKITIVEKPGEAELRLLNHNATSVDTEASPTPSESLLTAADDTPTDMYYSSANTQAKTTTVNYALDWIRSKKIDLLINIPDVARRDEITAGYLLRRGAVDFGTSLLTNIKCAVLFCDALHRNRPLPCKSEEEYVGTAPTIGW